MPLGSRAGAVKMLVCVTPELLLESELPSPATTAVLVIVEPGGAVTWTWRVTRGANCPGARLGL